MKYDWFKNKEPNKVPCECGKMVWTVSQRVQQRALDCPKCGRYYLYRRTLGNKTSREIVGRYKGKNEREKRTLEYAKEIGQ